MRNPNAVDHYLVICSKDNKVAHVWKYTKKPTRALAELRKDYDVEVIVITKEQQRFEARAD